MAREQHSRDAYQNRDSTTTRNPHAATKKPRSAKDLADLSPEDRVIAQWRSACGAPISDEAKTQFGVIMDGVNFPLGDVRLWGKSLNKQDGKETGSIFLEFFFDGSPTELENGEAPFIQAFEQKIATELQERRISTFRKKLAARKRRPHADAADDAEGGGGADHGDDDDWKSFLSQPAPATELSVRSIREAGCMIRFLVCQTSLSVAAAEALGQAAFPEFFPVDGIAQAPPTSGKPLPRWVYGLYAGAAVITSLALLAWGKVAAEFMNPDIPLPP